MLVNKQIIDKSFNVEYIQKTGSTNSDLKELALGGGFSLAPDKIAEVLVADHQTAGRGRQNRQWHSEPGHSLLMSLMLSPEFWIFEELKEGEDQKKLHFLNSCFALAALRACRGFSKKEGFIKKEGSGAQLKEVLQLKWPNDLVALNPKTKEIKKLAGILSELVGKFLIIGIGVNLETPNIGIFGDTKEARELGEMTPLPPIGLNQVSDARVSRDDLLQGILGEFGAIYLELAEFEKSSQGDFWGSELHSSIQKEVLSNSAFMGEEVKVYLGGKKKDIISGKVEGLTDMGELILKTKAGTRELQTGDIVRKNV